MLSDRLLNLTEMLSLEIGNDCMMPNDPFRGDRTCVEIGPRHGPCQGRFKPCHAEILLKLMWNLPTQDIPVGVDFGYEKANEV